MIVVKVELHSAITGRVTELGRMIVANVGGTRKRGDYKVKVGRKRAGGEPIPNEDVWAKPQRTGSVKDYPRLSYNVWRLISRAILSAFPEEGKK
jgi:hypothetical protein